MQQLKELLVPSTNDIAVSKIATRSRWIYLKPKIITFLIVFTLVMIGYTLFVSLTYKPVTLGPSYNASITTYYTMNDFAEGMLVTNIAPSVAISTLYFLNSFNYTTDCDAISITEDSYAIAIFSTLGNQTGCYINVTVNYTFPNNTQGDYYFITPNGFSFAPDVYHNQSGDIIFRTEGYMKNGIAVDYNTEVVFQFKTGFSNSNVMLSTSSNQWLALTFDIQAIYLFALSISSWIWLFTCMILTKIISKLRKEKVHTTIVSDNTNLFFEV